MRVHEEAGAILPRMRALADTERTAEKVILCSDGSFVRGVAGSGVYCSAGSGVAFRTVGEQSIWNAEAQGALVALRWLDNNPELKATLVIDNKGVANTIQGQITGARCTVGWCCKSVWSYGRRLEIEWRWCGTPAMHPRS